MNVRGRHRGWVTLLTGALLLGGCHPDADLTDPAPGGPAPWQPAVPANLTTAPIPEPARNPMTREGAALGKLLFFDPRLSGANTISCATCHEPAKAFSDGVALANHGASGTALLRHAPALQNLAWATGYFWDGGALDLESQAFGPLTSPDEMAQDLRLLPAELAAVPDYAARFAAAFPGQGITSATIGRALAQYQRTLITANSPYDRWVRREPGAVLSTDAQAGLLVVRARCGTCHAGEFFSDYGYHNNGLDSTYSPAHERLAWGRGRITELAADVGAYKTPTLRNVALTAPYMHDGRFATLDAVLDHYARGLRPSTTLDPVLRDAAGRPQPLPLSADERRQVLAFLQALTDTSFARP